MRRSVALLAVATLLPLLGGMPVAHAAPGLAACTIGGTITFAPSPATPTEGTWRVGPATIDCQGTINALDRILGTGPFRASGTYGPAPSNTGSCLHSVGSGEVDYTLPTTLGPFRIVEPHAFTLVGAGVFDTPSLGGTFQVRPPYDGDCVTTPVTRAGFLAEGLLIRQVSGPFTTPPGGETTP